MSLKTKYTDEEIQKAMEETAEEMYQQLLLEKESGRLYPTMKERREQSQVPEAMTEE